MLASAMKAMFTLHTTPATAINAALGIQWYQRSCTRAEKRQQIRAIFGYFLEKSGAVIKKYTLINSRALAVPLLQRHKKTYELGTQCS